MLVKKGFSLGSLLFFFAGRRLKEIIEEDGRDPSLTRALFFVCERAPQPEAIRFSEAAAAQRRCWEKTNDERKAEKVQANVIIS